MYVQYTFYYNFRYFHKTACVDCLKTNVQFFRMRVLGELPQLSLTISDARLQEILQLVQSIPFPEGSPPPPEDEIDYNVMVLVTHEFACHHFANFYLWSWKKNTKEVIVHVLHRVGMLISGARYKEHG